MNNCTKKIRLSELLIDVRQGSVDAEDAAAKIEEMFATPPAAQVQGEREKYETWIRSLPDATGALEESLLAWSEDEQRYCHDGEKCTRAVQSGWVAWKARAALSAPPAAGVPEAVHVLRKAYEGHSAGLFNSGAPKHLWSAAMLELFESLDEEVQEEARETVMAHSDMRAVAAIDSVIALLAAAPTPPASEQQQAVVMPDDAFKAEFMTWWEEHGQYCRAGGGNYERSFAFEAWRHLYPRLIQASLNPHLAGVNQGVTEAGNGGDV